MARPKSKLMDNKYFGSSILPKPGWEEFAQNYVNNPDTKDNATASYIYVYGDRVKKSGEAAASLARNSKILQRIAYLRTINQKKLQKMFNLSRDEWLSRWETLSSASKKDETQIKALENIGKACGWYEQGDNEAKAGGISISISVNTSGRKLEAGPAPGAVVDVAAVAIPEHGEAEFVPDTVSDCQEIAVKHKETGGNN